MTPDTRGRTYRRAQAGEEVAVTFSRETGLERHSITEGRHSGERLSRIVTFGVSSFTASDPAREFLKLSSTAENVENGMSGAGRAQGTAFRIGKGRVIVLSDTNMAAAELCGGDTSKPIGLRYPGGRQPAVRSAFDALAVKPARRLRMNSEA